MKVFILLSISAFLQYSASDSARNGSSTISKPKKISGKKHLRQSAASLSSVQNQYVLLISELGHVIIFNPRTYGEEAAYYEPNLAHKTVAIADNSLYCIDKLKGIIKRCPLQDIFIRPENSIYWEHVGWFSSEQYADRTVAVVDNNLIYFTTRRGILYNYNMTSKKVTTSANLEPDVYYNSITKIENSIFIAGDYPNVTFTNLKLKNDIWVNNTEFKQIDAISDAKKYPALFTIVEKAVRFSRICCVGGDSKDHISQYPVYCFDNDPNDFVWRIDSYSREARQNPGIAVTDSGVFIFGGSRNFKNETPVLLKTVEFYDFKTSSWSYIPTPPSMIPNYYSAIPFNYGK